MKCAGSGLGFHFDGARTVAAVLSAVVRGKHFEFGDGIEAGIDVQGGVGAVVHVVPAVEFPVVVLDAAAIHAVADVAVNTNVTFIVDPSD